MGAYLSYVIVGYLAIGTVIMYWALNQKNLATWSGFLALLCCIILWLPIIVKWVYIKLKVSPK